MASIYQHYLNKYSNGKLPRTTLDDLTDELEKINQEKKYKIVMSKNYTSKNQSEILIKLGIPIDTADMWYQHIGYSITDGKEKPTYFPMVIRDNISDDDIPAWSLTALMKLLPSEFTTENKFGKYKYEITIRKYKFVDNVDIYQIAYGNYKWYEDGSNSWKDMINTGQKEELLDAAFEMVVWLKENGKI